MSPLGHANLYLRRTTVTGLVALICAITAAIMAVTLVIRGEPDGLGEWGVLIGLFLTGANGLLAEHRTATHRATDPDPEGPR